MLIANKWRHAGCVCTGAECCGGRGLRSVCCLFHPEDSFSLLTFFFSNVFEIFVSTGCHDVVSSSFAVTVMVNTNDDAATWFKDGHAGDPKHGFHSRTKRDTVNMNVQNPQSLGC